MKKRSAFTLIELLVVLGIIGILLLISLLALNVARARSRDYQRIADIEKIRANLELYFNNNNSYPRTEGGPIPLGTVETSCLSDAGFLPADCPGAIMPLVPRDPKAGLYLYISETGETYTIRVILEREINGLSGVIEAYPSAIVPVSG